MTDDMERLFAGPGASLVPIKQWMERLQDLLDKTLSPRWMAVSIGIDNDCVRIVLAGGTDVPARLEVYLQPKSTAAGTGFYSETARFHLYYHRPGTEGLSRLGAQNLERIMEAVRIIVKRYEGCLADADVSRLSRRPKAPQDPQEGEDLLVDSKFRLNETAFSVFSGSPKLQHYLRINFVCNQRCPFCFVALTGRRVEAQAIERYLEDFRQHGDPRIPLVITGGEPTCDPRLCEILQMARTKGIARWELQTNAVRLADPRLASRLEALGVGNYMVSFHSHLPALYNKMTGSQGQYPLALGGIRNLLKMRKGGVCFNIVINRLNYKTLPAHARFIVRLAKGCKKKLQIFYSQMSKEGYGRSPELAVDLKLVAPYLNEALACCRREGLSVARFEGDCALPVCVAANPADYVSRKRCPNNDASYEDIVSHDLPGRLKRLACKSCRYDSHCRGVPGVYACRFGLGALVPRV